MKSLGLQVNTIADFIAWKFLSGGKEVSVLKLQKLLYYTQAWSLALNEESIFEEDFEAWVHGPCCPSLFQRFKYEHDRTMYDLVEEKFLKHDAAQFEASIGSDLNNHIDNVLEVYGKYTGTQLEDITHQEDPWMNAREGLGPYESSGNIITKESIANYYKKRIAN